MNHAAAGFELVAGMVVFERLKITRSDFRTCAIMARNSRLLFRLTRNLTYEEAQMVSTNILYTYHRISRKRQQPARLALVVGVAVIASACASPSAIRANQTTGFNGYFTQLPTACNPLIIGGQNVGDNIRFNNTGAPNYPYFLQVTSKLYYHQLTPAEYRQAVVGFYGAGADSDKSIDCIVNTLPADRPTAPVGID